MESAATPASQRLKIHGSSEAPKVWTVAVPPGGTDAFTIGAAAGAAWVAACAGRGMSPASRKAGGAGGVRETSRRGRSVGGGRRGARDAPRGREGGRAGERSHEEERAQSDRVARGGLRACREGQGLRAQPGGSGSAPPHGGA